MNRPKNLIILAGFVLSISLLSSSLTAGLLTRYYSRLQMQTLGGFCRDIISGRPEAKDTVLSLLKGYKEHSSFPEDAGFLSSCGYRQDDFSQAAEKNYVLFIAAGFLSGGILFLLTLLFRHKKELSRIQALTEYLERINTGSSGVLLFSEEDDFSRLQDEIYKTVTLLYQTRETAVKAKNNFAENLYNIAHQLKTPVTAISLSVQRMSAAVNTHSKSTQKIFMEDNTHNSSQPDSSRHGSSIQTPPLSVHLEQIRAQLSRLTHLEEALLLLSRIDAGTLSLKREQIDVFTLLMLSADNLQELFDRADVSIDIPESGEMIIEADMDWTMEAMINLLKNCMEHTPPGKTVHCACAQNLLYTQIRIWDEGEGFAREDIPRLFERFYRGQNTKNGGIGIGLAISRAILESQNGTITAENLPQGGACFEIRFYSH